MFADMQYNECHPEHFEGDDNSRDSIGNKHPIERQDNDDDDEVATTFSNDNGNNANNHDDTKNPNEQLIDIRFNKDNGDVVQFLSRIVLSGINCPRNIRIFDLQNSCIGNNDGMKLLSDVVRDCCSPTLTIRSMILRQCNISNGGCIVLASMIRQNESLLQSIGSIDLQNNTIGDDGITELLTALEPSTSIRTLDVGYNRITAIGAVAIAKFITTNMSIQDLYLGFNPFGDSGALAIAQAFEQPNVTIRNLVIGYNRITGQGGSAFAKALQYNTTLQHLNLQYNVIGTSATDDILSTLQYNNRTLRSLHLTLYDTPSPPTTTNPIATTIASVLCENHILQQFYLSGGINDHGAIQIGRALRTNQGLQILDLRNNQISNNGVSEIAVALRNNTTLQTLNLNSNTITDDGIIALAESLQYNTTLEVLDVGSNRIGDSGAIVLATAFVQQTKILSITSLSIESNYITDNGIRALSEVLKVNEKLTTINIGGTNRISDIGVIALQDAMDYNDTLYYIGEPCKRDEDYDYESTGSTSVSSLSLLSFESLLPIVEMNRTKSRIAYKKVERRQRIIYNSLLLNWIPQQMSR